MITSVSDLDNAEEHYQRRVTRILTTDLPQYFAVLTRIRQESNGIGTEGGVISSTVVPQVQAVFPEGSLTKNIKVGLQVSGCCPTIVSLQVSEMSLLFNGVCIGLGLS